jgi:hypothetical protein
MLGAPAGRTMRHEGSWMVKSTVQQQASFLTIWIYHLTRHSCRWICWWLSKHPTLIISSTEVRRDAPKAQQHLTYALPNMLRSYWVCKLTEMQDAKQRQAKRAECTKSKRYQALSCIKSIKRTSIHGVGRRRPDPGGGGSKWTRSVRQQVAPSGSWCRCTARREGTEERWAEERVSGFRKPTRRERCYLSIRPPPELRPLAAAPAAGGGRERMPYGESRSKWALICKPLGGFCKYLGRDY